MIKGFKAGDDLVLAKGNQKIRKLMLRNVELTHGLSQGNKDGMAGGTLITLVKLGLPLAEQGQRLLGISYFIAQIVGNAAVGIYVEKVLAQPLGQEPCGDRKILVMALGELRTIGLRLPERRSRFRNAV